MTLSIEWRLALKGRYSELEAAREEALARGLTQGLRAAARQIVKPRLRAGYAAAGLGRLARAWRVDVYPQRGESLGAALSVGPKGDARTRGALESHGVGAVIRSQRRRMVAVPAPWVQGRRGTARRRISPSSAFFGGVKMRLVPLRSQMALLVVDLPRAPARSREWVLARRGRGASRRVTVIAFVLLPVVRQRPRVDLPGITAAIAKELPGFLTAHVEEEMKKVETRIRG